MTYWDQHYHTFLELELGWTFYIDLEKEKSGCGTPLSSKCATAWRKVCDSVDVRLICLSKLCHQSKDWFSLVILKVRITCLRRCFTSRFCCNNLSKLCQWFLLYHTFFCKNAFSIYKIIYSTEVRIVCYPYRCSSFELYKQITHLSNN